MKSGIINLTKLMFFSFFLSPALSAIKDESGFNNCLNDQVPELANSLRSALINKISDSHDDVAKYYCDSKGCSNNKDLFIKGKEKKRASITCLFSTNLAKNCYSYGTDGSSCVGSVNGRSHGNTLVYLPSKLIDYTNGLILNNVLENIDSINGYISNNKPAISGKSYRGWTLKILWMGYHHIVANCIIERFDREIFCVSYTGYHHQIYFFQFVTNISSSGTTKSKISEQYSESKTLEFSTPLINNNLDFFGKNDSINLN